MIEIELNNIKKNYGLRNILDGFSLDLHYGEKVALIGENGSGKSTLIKIILGKDIDFMGEVNLGTSIKLGYISQNIIFNDNNKTVLDYFLEGNNFSETEARCKLAKYGFRQEAVFKKVGKLSGGEKVRIILMKLIEKDINFLILDEPTNHIDIDTREILEEALKQYKGTVLFVSHDRFFINAISVISRHISNIFKEKELEKNSTVANFATVQNESGRTVTRNIDYYNLDVIISIGYI